MLSDERIFLNELGRHLHVYISTLYHSKICTDDERTFKDWPTVKLEKSRGSYFTLKDIDVMSHVKDFVETKNYSILNTTGEFICNCNGSKIMIEYNENMKHLHILFLKTTTKHYLSCTETGFYHHEVYD